MNKQEMLDMLAEKVSKCEKCNLCKTRTQTVFGQGDPNTKVVLIGEGPGKDEDAQGIPFCGRCGQLLTNILGACNISRESVYICNVVKCRPPGNRTPEPEEISACKSFLELQLKIINPKYILCLGATAAKSLLNVETPIGRLRGEWHQYNNAKVLATFHPSYGLRVSSAKHEIYKDLMIMVEELKKTTA